MGKNYKMNNAGFSLVELIVSVLITGVLMLAVSMFLASSRNTFQTVNTSATLQEESMTTERILNEYILEAKKYGLDKNVSISGVSTDVFWVLAGENEGTSEDDVAYIFVLDKDKKVLRYCRGTEADVEPSSGKLTAGGIGTVKTRCFGSNEKYSLIANYVESMKCTPVNRPDGTDLVCLEIKYEFMGKTYTDNLTSVTRNKTGVTSVSGVPAGSGAPAGSGGGT